MNEILGSLKVVSEEIRIRILMLLVDREACVCELMRVFDMAQSKLSHHLILLRDAGFLQDDKRGKWNYYRINTKVLSTVNRELLISLSRWVIDDEVIIHDRQALEKINRCTVSN